MARGKRKKIASGVYEDSSGIAAIVSVHGRRKEKRYPKGTPLKELRRWQADMRSALQGLASPAHRGTLTAEVARFLKQHKHLKSWRSRRIELGHWIARYGTWSRWKIGKAQVLESRVAWLEAGKSPKTINNRVAALSSLYHALDGKRAPTPCDEVEALPWTPPPPRVVGPTTILTVFQNIQTHPGLRKARYKHLARFMVTASTGRRPCEVMRTEPGDLDYERRVWRTRDAKGGYTPGGLYLNDDMLIAWQFFAAVGCWGAYRTADHARALRVCGWPAGIRPYNLRHTLGITLSEAGVDLKAVADWLGQSNTDVTRAHYVPVLGSRMQASSNVLSGRFGWEAPTPPDESKKFMAPDDGTLRKSRKQGG
jgi:integrase